LNSLRQAVKNRSPKLEKNFPTPEFRIGKLPKPTLFVILAGK
jgi:hypothetical protein